MLRSTCSGWSPVWLALVTALLWQPNARGAALERMGAREAPVDASVTRGLVWLRREGSTMIEVPASTFWMGSTPEQVVAAVAECTREPLGHRCSPQMFADEMPRHRVQLAAFWLDRTEVTVARYARCVALRRCRPIPFGDGALRFEADRLPATLVSWADARRYCAFRGARLPTEAEFERAARGLDGRIYPWGRSFHSKLVNHGRYAFDSADASDGFAELAPVGSFPDGKTPSGFLDLAGNAAEWVLDAYTPGYPEQRASVAGLPPPPAFATTARVIRGGSYLSARAWLRGAARQEANPELRAPHVGFRCARSSRPSMPRPTLDALP